MSRKSLILTPKAHAPQFGFTFWSYTLLDTLTHPPSLLPFRSFSLQVPETCKAIFVQALKEYLHRSLPLLRLLSPISCSTSQKLDKGNCSTLTGAYHIQVYDFSTNLIPLIPASGVESCCFIAPRTANTVFGSSKKDFL